MWPIERNAVIGLLAVIAFAPPVLGQSGRAPATSGVVGCWAFFDHAGRPASVSLYWAPAVGRLDSGGRATKMTPAFDVGRREGPGSYRWSVASDSVHIWFHSGFSGTEFILAPSSSGGDTLRGRAREHWDYRPVTDAGSAAAFRVRCPDPAELTPRAPRLSQEARPIVATVQRLFDAMSRHDTAALRALIVPGTQLVTISADSATAAAPRMQTDSAFLARLAARPERLLERMWDPVVRIDGPMATLWASYDFHVDGNFSHCGVDTATLVQTANGWRITGLVYTVQRSGCRASPLGQPR